MDDSDQSRRNHAKLVIALEIGRNTPTGLYSDLSIDFDSSSCYWKDIKVELESKDSFDLRSPETSWALAKLLIAYKLRLCNKFDYFKQMKARLANGKGSNNLRLFGGYVENIPSPKLLDIFVPNSRLVTINSNVLADTDINFIIRLKTDDYKETRTYPELAAAREKNHHPYCPANEAFLRVVHDQIVAKDWDFTEFEFEGPISIQLAESVTPTFTPHLPDRHQLQLFGEAERQESTKEHPLAFGPGALRGTARAAKGFVEGKTNVPLFWGSTLIKTIRELGYTNTTTAICELVDNAIEADATEIRVYFSQEGVKDKRNIDCLVYDNGRGMTSGALKYAMSFGGSSVHENRMKIGRFGIGMKSSALSLSSKLSVLTWQKNLSQQKNSCIHRMQLDVDVIADKTGVLSNLPDPDLIDDLPYAVHRILTEPIEYPEVSRKNLNAAQEVFASSSDIRARLGDSGTIAFIPSCDRLSASYASTLAKEAVEEMSRIYRHQISRKQLDLFVNNERVNPYDPTYFYDPAWYDKPDWLLKHEGSVIARSTFVPPAIEVEIPHTEGSKKKSSAVVKLYRLPIEDWIAIQKRTRRQAFRLGDEHVVSFVRNKREIAISSIAALKIGRHSMDSWIRVQIDFNGNLDEAFGISATKQGVRIKEYAASEIKRKLTEDLKRLRQELLAISRQRRDPLATSRTRIAERLAAESESTSQHSEDSYCEAEKADRDAALKSLAMQLKDEDEDISAAVERVNASNFHIGRRHDPFHPFYERVSIYGKEVLWINSAHPFYDSIWKPLSELGRSSELEVEYDGGLFADADNCSGENNTFTALLLMLLSFARTQSLIESSNKGSGAVFVRLRDEWSRRLATMLDCLDANQ